MQRIFTTKNFVDALSAGELPWLPCAAFDHAASSNSDAGHGSTFAWISGGQKIWCHVIIARKSHLILRMWTYLLHRSLIVYGTFINTPSGATGCTQREVCLTWRHKLRIVHGFSMHLSLDILSWMLKRCQLSRHQSLFPRKQTLWHVTGRLWKLKRGPSCVESKWRCEVIIFLKLGAKGAKILRCFETFGKFSSKTEDAWLRLPRSQQPKQITSEKKSWTCVPQPNGAPTSFCAKNEKKTEAKLCSSGSLSWHRLFVWK